MPWVSLCVLVTEKMALRQTRTHVQSVVRTGASDHVMSLEELGIGAVPCRNSAQGREQGVLLGERYQELGEAGSEKSGVRVPGPGCID